MKSVTPHFFYLLGKGKSLPFCVASLKKIVHALLGANGLKSDKSAQLGHIFLGMQNIHSRLAAINLLSLPYNKQ